MMKKVPVLFVLIVVMLFFCAETLIACSYSSVNTYPQTQKNIMFIGCQYYPGNSRQYEASVQMTVFEEHLYFSSESSGDSGRALYVLKDGKIEQVTQLARDVMAMGEGFVYYSDADGDAQWGLYCYEIASGRTTKVMPMERNVYGSCMDWYPSCFAEDGTFYLCAYDTRWPVTGTVAGEPTQSPETYTLGGYRFYTAERKLMRQEGSGIPQSLSADVPDGLKYMIPCEGGLLVHKQYGDLGLYFVEEASGEIVELFSAPCFYSVSALNVRGKDVYLSFKRFEKEGLFGVYTRFRNDEMEGTYRICLENYAVEKISDKIYDGLYIFDDTGIYACDEDCRVYKLDFDGNVIATILK